LEKEALVGGLMVIEIEEVLKTETFPIVEGGVYFYR